MPRPPLQPHPNPSHSPTSPPSPPSDQLDEITQTLNTLHISPTGVVHRRHRERREQLRQASFPQSPPPPPPFPAPSTTTMEEENPLWLPSAHSVPSSYETNGGYTATRSQKLGNRKVEVLRDKLRRLEGSRDRERKVEVCTGNDVRELYEKFGQGSGEVSEDSDEGEWEKVREEDRGERWLVVPEDPDEW